MYRRVDRETRNAGSTSTSRRRMLPMEEAIEAITDQVFAPLVDWPRSERGGAAQYQAFLRQFPDTPRSRSTRAMSSSPAPMRRRPQRHNGRVRGTRQPARPAFVLRMHRLAHSRDRQAPTLTTHGLLVAQKVSSLILRREYRLDVIVTTGVTRDLW